MDDIINAPEGSISVNMTELQEAVNATSIAAAMRILLRSLETETFEREGLSETPLRAAKAWAHWCGGYAIDPVALLKTFEDGAQDYDEMVLQKDIPFHSHCEHHLASIIGLATVAYIPYKRIVGLSKMNRVVDAYARRLQVQERLTTQIAHCLNEGLEPRGVAVQIRARHMCIESRGIAHRGTVTTSQVLLGVFRTDPAVRAEFIKLAESNAVI